MCVVLCCENMLVVVMFVVCVRSYVSCLCVCCGHVCVVCVLFCVCCVLWSCVCCGHVCVVCVQCSAHAETNNAISHLFYFCFARVRCACVCACMNVLFESASVRLYACVRICVCPYVCVYVCVCRRARKSDTVAKRRRRETRE